MPAYMKSMLNESGKLDLSKAPDTAAIRGYSKKMVATLNRELTKIQPQPVGHPRDEPPARRAWSSSIRKREHIAVKEAQRMGVTTVALIDTDSDPDTVDLPIPGNDDSIRSIELILAKLADAVLEGRAALPPEGQPAGRGRQPQTQPLPQPQPQTPPLPQPVAAALTGNGAPVTAAPAGRVEA